MAGESPDALGARMAQLTYFGPLPDFLAGLQDAGQPVDEVGDPSSTG